MQNAEDRAYVARMLCIWQVEGQSGVSLRASPEGGRSGERQSFPGLEALFAYLSEYVGIRQMHCPGQKEGQR